MSATKAASGGSAGDSTGLQRVEDRHSNGAIVSTSRLSSEGVIDLAKLGKHPVSSSECTPLTPLVAPRAGPADKAITLCMWAQCVYSSSPNTDPLQQALQQLRYAAVYYLATKLQHGKVALGPSHRAVVPGLLLGSFLASVATDAWDQVPGDVDEKFQAICDGRIVCIQDEHGDVSVALDGPALHKAAVETVLERAAAFEQKAEQQLQWDEANAKSLIPAGLLEISPPQPAAYWTQHHTPNGHTHGTACHHVGTPGGTHRSNQALPLHLDSAASASASGSEGSMELDDSLLLPAGLLSSPPPVMGPPGVAAAAPAAARSVLGDRTNSGALCRANGTGAGSLLQLDSKRAAAGATSTATAQPGWQPVAGVTRATGESGGALTRDTPPQEGRRSVFEAMLQALPGPLLAGREPAPAHLTEQELLLTSSEVGEDKTDTHTSSAVTPLATPATVLDPAAGTHPVNTAHIDPPSDSPRTYDPWRVPTPPWLGVNEHVTAALGASALSSSAVQSSGTGLHDHQAALSTRSIVGGGAPQQQVEPVDQWTATQVSLALACLSIWWPAHPCMTALSLALVSTPPQSVAGAHAAGPVFVISLQQALAEVQRLQRQVVLGPQAVHPTSAAHNAMAVLQELLMSQPVLVLEGQGLEGAILGLLHDVVAQHVLASVGLGTLDPTATAIEPPAVWPPAVPDWDALLQLLHPQAQELLLPAIPMLRLECGQVARAQLLAAALRQLAAMLQEPPVPAAVPVTAAPVARAKEALRQGLSAGDQQRLSLPQVHQPSTEVGTALSLDQPATVSTTQRLVQLARMAFEHTGIHECTLRCAAVLHLAGRQDGSSQGLAGSQAGGAVTCEQLGQLLGREQPGSWEYWQRLNPGDTASQVRALLHGVPGFVMVLSASEASSQPAAPAHAHGPRQLVVLDPEALHQAAVTAAQHAHRYHPYPQSIPAPQHPAQAPATLLRLASPSGRYRMHASALPTLPPISPYGGPYASPQLVRPLMVPAPVFGSMPSTPYAFHSPHVSIGGQQRSSPPHPPPPPPPGPPPGSWGAASPASSRSLRTQYPSPGVSQGSPGHTLHRAGPSGGSVLAKASSLTLPQLPGTVPGVATAQQLARTPPARPQAVAWASAAATRAVVEHPPVAPPPPRRQVTQDQLQRWAVAAFPGPAVLARAQRAMVTALAEVTSSDGPFGAHCRSATDLGQVLAERHPSLWAGLTPMTGTKKYRLRPLIDSSPVFMRIKKPPSDCWIKLNVKELMSASTRVAGSSTPTGPTGQLQLLGTPPAPPVGAEEHDTAADLVGMAADELAAGAPPAARGGVSPSLTDAPSVALGDGDVDM